MEKKIQEPALGEEKRSEGELFGQDGGFENMTRKHHEHRGLLIKG